MASSKPSPVRTLFESALDLAPEQRERFVIEHSGGDARLVEAVLDLLQSHQEAGDGFLANPWVEAPVQPPLQAGAVLGPYRIVSELGSGGMGTVYCADRSDGIYERRVALKVIQPGQNRDEVREWFHNERRVLGKLDHPNIVRIIDGGNTGAGHPYYVMDYVAGEPIDRYCAGKRLTVAQRLELFKQVCLAVEYLHQQHIVHRDIKPSNILVDGDGIPKLLDFGISRFTADSSSFMPNEGRRLTVAYASPEQIQGDIVSERSDVYSLGVVLHELLTGRRPFERGPDESLEEFSSAILTRELTLPSTRARQGMAEGLPDSPAQLGRVIQGDLDSILLKALDRDPEHRYFSPARLAEDIERYLTCRPVVARSGNVAYRASKFTRRNRKMVGAAAIVVMLGIFSGNLVLKNHNLTTAHARLRQITDQFAMSLGMGAGAVGTISSLSDEQVQSLTGYANEFHDTFADAIRIRPGLTSERQEILDGAMRLIDHGRDIAKNDPDKQYWVAIAYYAIANLQGYPQETSLGDTEGALKSYDQSRDLADQILSVRPEDSRARELLGRIEARIAVTKGQVRN